jgi:hypothetical protein
MGWINKSWVLEGQLLMTVKRVDPLKSKPIGTVTHLKSGLVEFSHPLD